MLLSKALVVVLIVALLVVIGVLCWVVADRGRTANLATLMRAAPWTRK